MSDGENACDWMETLQGREKGVPKGIRHGLGIRSEYVVTAADIRWIAGQGVVESAKSVNRSAMPRFAKACQALPGGVPTGEASCLLQPSVFVHCSHHYA